MSCKKEMQSLLRSAEQDFGATVIMTNSQHYKVIPPNGGKILWFPSTPSDRRGVYNARADLRKVGLAK